MSNEPEVHFVGFNPATVASASEFSNYAATPRVTSSNSFSSADVTLSHPQTSSPLSSNQAALAYADNSLSAPANDSAIPAVTPDISPAAADAEGVTASSSPEAHDGDTSGAGARVRPGVKELQAVVELRGAEAAARLRAEFGSAAALASLLGSGSPRPSISSFTTLPAILFPSIYCT